MKRPRLKRIVGSALALAALGPIAKAGSMGPPSYGAVNFYGRSASALNDAGQVAMSAQPRGDNGNYLPIQGLLYNGYGPNAGTLAPINPTTADGSAVVGPTTWYLGINGINNSGTMVVNTRADWLAVSNLQGAVVSGGAATRLPGLDGPQDQVSVAGINDAGAVAGSSYSGISTANSHAFVSDAKGTHDLGTLGGHSSWAEAINNAGQVVGVSTINNSGIAFAGPSHAFLSDGQPGHALTDLGTLGGTNSSANAINNLGDIVGGSQLANSSLYHAFERTAGAMHDLGTLAGPDGYSWARGINDSGQVVGQSEISGGGQHAFLYQNGVMYDLNDLVKDLGPWVLTDVLTINNHGQILATANDSAGSFTSFLLTPSDYAQPAPAPIPEPGTFALFAAAIAGSVALKKRKRPAASAL